MRDATPRDDFDGAWMVKEYVHDPGGELIGTVSQRRLVEPADTDRFRVTQHCSVSDELRDHPMTRFEGTWVFDLAIEGAQRHYLGPDVIGMGTQWAPGAMTGVGQWPRFGHDFESYAVLIAPDRQLTGGFFSTAGQSFVDIIGIAVPEVLGVEPQLELTAGAPDLDRDAWPVQRAVGPMRIGTAQATPNLRRRCWTMHDAHGGSTITIVETVDAGGVSTTITAQPN